MNKIIVGACQYNIGTYVARFPEVYEKMMGREPSEVEIAFLDSLIEKQLDKAEKSRCYPEIHILYSKKELTYERQIKDLLLRLEGSRFPTILVEETFEDHSEVGKYFGPYLKKLFVE